MNKAAKKKLKHILLVVDNYPPKRGGAELVYERLVEGLRAARLKVTVVTTGGPGLPAHDIVDNVEIVRLGENRYAFIWRAFWYLIRSGLRPDLVHTATYAAALPAWLFARLRRIPAVLTVHEVLGSVWFRGMNKWLAYGYYWFERLILALSFDRYVAVSAFTGKRLEAVGKPPAKIRTVENGVDDLAPSPQADAVRSKLGIPSDQFLFLYFGRLGISKGLLVLRDAAQHIVAEQTDAHVAFVVAEAAHDDLYRALSAFQLAHPLQVSLFSALDKQTLVDLITAADCVVVPSYSEGFGLSAIEACLLKRPIVASGGSALKDHLWGQVNFFPPGDTKALAEAMRKARRGEFPSIRKKHAFTWEKMTEGYRAVYKELT
jgi:glycosyltransferase involved in cell wall biosynthesis